MQNYGINIFCMKPGFQYALSKQMSEVPIFRFEWKTLLPTTTERNATSIV